MGITRDHTIAVCDLNHFTVARTLAAPADNTTGHRDDLCTLASREIDAFMPRFFSTEWIDTAAVSRRQPSRQDGAAFRCCIAFNLLALNQLGQYIELNLAIVQGCAQGE